MWAADTQCGLNIYLDTIRQETLECSPAHPDSHPLQECHLGEERGVRLVWVSRQEAGGSADQSGGLTVRLTPNSDQWRPGPIIDALQSGQAQSLLTSVFSSEL